MVLEKRSFEQAIPAESERQAGWRKAIEGRKVEAALLSRDRGLRVRYRLLENSELGL
jgi:hypothetical protein